MPLDLSSRKLLSPLHSRRLRQIVAPVTPI